MTVPHHSPTNLSLPLPYHEQGESLHGIFWKRVINITATCRDVQMNPIIKAYFQHKLTSSTEKLVSIIASVHQAARNRFQRKLSHC